MKKIDWSSGVRLDEKPTASCLRGAAKIALKHANEWADTAERLLAKAAHLPKEQNDG